jgi:hypothetical protein
MSNNAYNTTITNEEFAVCVPTDYVADGSKVDILNAYGDYYMWEQSDGTYKVQKGYDVYGVIYPTDESATSYVMYATDQSLSEEEQNIDGAIAMYNQRMVDLNPIVQENQSLEEENQDLQESNDNLEEENQSLEENNENLEEENQDLESYNEALERENKDASVENYDLKQEYKYNVIILTSVIIILAILTFATILYNILSKRKSSQVQPIAQDNKDNDKKNTDNLNVVENNQIQSLNNNATNNNQENVANNIEINLIEQNNTDKSEANKISEQQQNIRSIIQNGRKQQTNRQGQFNLE